MEEKNKRVTYLKVAASGEGRAGEGREKPWFSELEISLQTRCRKIEVALTASTDVLRS